MNSVSKELRSYEEQTLAPLVREAGYEPLTDNLSFTVCKGSAVFMMNNADDFSYVGDFIHWTPLSVFYKDENGASGSVYSIKASYEPKSGMIQLQKAELTSIAILERQDTKVVWKDAFSGRIFIKYPDHEADKVLMNSWYLFRGAILPMLERDMYRFVDDTDKLAFQQTMIRHINNLYQSTPDS